MQRTSQSALQSKGLTERACGTWQGDFKSIMVIVTPCRSDLSEQGLSPLSHLADGRLTLVLVKRCSVAAYLKFLIAIPRTGGCPSLLDTTIIGMTCPGRLVACCVVCALLHWDGPTKNCTAHVDLCLNLLRLPAQP